MGSQDGSDGMFFYGNQALNAAVTNGQPFYFLASKCGTDHAEANVGGTNYMQFKTTLMSSFSANGGDVMTHQEMLETNIVCNYEMNIDNIMVSIDTELDAVDNDDKIEEDNTAKALDSAVVVHSTKVDSAAYSSGDVTLGSLVEITFESVGEITTGFYIDSCTASNNAKDVNTILIKDGCPNQTAGEPISSISPGVTGATLNYEQFAYVAASSSDAGNPDLEFNLSCVLKFGTQPTSAQCAGVNTNLRRRRRAASDEGATTEFALPVALEEGQETQTDADGVVTVSPNQKPNSNSGVQQLAAALATSAFLLL